MNLHHRSPPDFLPKHERPPLVSPQPDPPLLQSPVTPADWPLLLQQTERFAGTEIRGYGWREVSEGVLPSGYDASSVAAEAIAEFLREQAAQPFALTPQQLRQPLKKCARKIINRLHHRMENEIMVSECDLYPIVHEYGEVIGALETFPGPDLDAAEILLAKEQAAEFEQLKLQFVSLLDRDKLLKELFGCFCAGIIKREAIARELGLPVNAIKNAQARLGRRQKEFRCWRKKLLAAAG